MFQNNLLKEAAKAEDTAKVLTVIQGLMKYITPGLPVPHLKIVDNLGSRWLGRCKWDPLLDTTTAFIEVQKSILVDDTTLSRVCAHELCHFDYYLTFWRYLSKGQQMTYNLMTDFGHGEEFLKRAAKFNAVFGADFVTPKSDSSYVLEENTREFYVLITPPSPVCSYWRWATSGKLSPKQRAFVDRLTENGRSELAQIFTSTDKSLLGGGEIGKGWTRPREGDIAKLMELWNGSPVVLPEAKAPKPVDPNREFFLALRDAHNLKYFAWSASLTPRQKAQLEKQVTDPWKVVKCKDKDFMTKKLGVGWDSAFLRWGTMADRWQEMWNSYPVVMSGNLGRSTTASKTARVSTDTPAFKSWFKGSKVVDDAGQPLMVYKGMFPYDYTKDPNCRSGEPLDVIQRPSAFPSIDEKDPEGISVAGFFAANPDVANKFIYTQGAVFPCFLAIKKPYVIDVKGARAGTFQFGQEGKPFRDAVRSGAYDGVIIKNTDDEGTIFIPLRSNQIKSAIGNNGEFNPESPRITAGKKASDRWQPPRPVNHSPAYGNPLLKRHLKRLPLEEGLSDVAPFDTATVSGFRGAVEHGSVGYPQFKYASASGAITIYRGEGPASKKNGKYWSPSAEFAAQFTQTGEVETVRKASIHPADIYTPAELSYAGDPDEIEFSVAEAKSKGFKAVWLDEGGNEPNSIYVFNPMCLKRASKTAGESHGDRAERLGLSFDSNKGGYWAPTLDHPSVMYHQSAPDNRESIRQHGLLRSKGMDAQMGGDGGTFLDTHPGSRESWFDTWQVDVSGLELERDQTTDIDGNPEYDGHEWWVTYGEDIPPSRLKLMKPLKKKASSDLWERYKADLGTVYHGTTLPTAKIIQKNGFRGLEWDTIQGEVLALYGKRYADLTDGIKLGLEAVKNSYSHEDHLVSTSPSGEVALRFAGGGEVASAIEAHILGVLFRGKVINPRTKGSPAVVVCRIKNFENTPHYERAMRTITYWDDAISKGKTTPDRAFHHAWHDYVNYLVEPNQLEVLRVISGGELEKLKESPIC